MTENYGNKRLKMKKINFIRATVRKFLKDNFNLRDKSQLIYILERLDYAEAPETVKAMVREHEFTSILLDNADLIWKDYNRKEDRTTKLPVKKKKMVRPKFKFKPRR